MKWKYETKSQWFERVSKWHRWFAWYPVWDNGKGFWLTYVERRVDRFLGCYFCEYREINKDSGDE